MSVKAYSDSRGRHNSAVTRAISSGYIIRGEDGLIDPEQADRDWLSRNDKRPKNNTGEEQAEESGNLAEAKLLDVRYTAKLKQLTYEEKVAKLVPEEPIDLWYTSMFTEFRESLLRVGPELQDELADERNPALIGSRITSVLVRILSQMKTYGIEEARKVA